MPPSGNPLAKIRDNIYELVEANSCKIGRNNLFNFRYVFTPNATVPIVGFYVPYPNCYVCINLFRACVSNVNFQYGVTHEVLTYRFNNGVGSYASTNSIYIFNQGEGMVFTRSETFVPGVGSTPPFMSVSFSQPGPVTTYLAGYGIITFVPSEQLAPLQAPYRDQYYQLNGVINGFNAEMIPNQPYNLYPYRRYNIPNSLLLPNTSYRLTPDVTLDPANVNNSSLLIRLVVNGCDTATHLTNTYIVQYYAFQGGSETVPPYTMLLRNGTTVISTPTGALNNSAGLTITPVLVTGSASVPPSVYFTGSATTFTGQLKLFVKLDVVCGAHDPANYS